MIFKESGIKGAPVMLFLHGGGLADWSVQPVTKEFETDYHVVSVVIDGHGEAADTTFLSIEDSASKLINYIHLNFDTRVHCLVGLSIGAQIVTEVLTREKDITTFAVIESALVYPIKGVTSFTLPIYKICYGLIQKRWFAKLQAKTLCVPDEKFEQYFEDSLKITRDSLINITISNGNYSLSKEIAMTNAKVMIIVGEKEISVMKKSAKKIHETISGSKLYQAPKMKHGELSLKYQEQYIAFIKDWFEEARGKEKKTGN